MGLGADQHIAGQRRILVQEGDREIVLEHDVMREGRIAGDQAADETRPCTD
jgi:hypothetical protein